MTGRAWCMHAARCRCRNYARGLRLVVGTGIHTGQARDGDAVLVQGSRWSECGYTERGFGRSLASLGERLPQMRGTEEVTCSHSCSPG